MALTLEDDLPDIVRWLVAGPDRERHAISPQRSNTWRRYFLNLSTTTCLSEYA